MSSSVAPAQPAPTGATVEPSERRGPRRWDRWFLAVAIPVGLCFAVAIPPVQEMDAWYHLPRTDRIARGHLIESVDDQGGVTRTIDACVHGFIIHHTERGQTTDPLDFGGNWRAVPCTTETPWSLTSAAVTSPVPYLPPALGYGIGAALGGDVHVRYLAARLASLAVYVLAVWFAILLAPIGRALLFAVAVLPSSLAQAAGVTTDGVTIWLSMLAVALVLRLRATDPVSAPERPPRALLAGLTVTLVALALTKNVQGPFVLLLLLVPRHLFTSRSGHLRYLAASAAAVGAAALLWLRQTAQVVIRVDPFLVDSEAQRAYFIEHPLAFPTALWRALWDPWVRDVTIPGMAEVLGGLRQPRVPHVLGDLPPTWVGLAALGVLVAAWLTDPARRAGPVEAGDGQPALAMRRTFLFAVVAAVALSSTVLIYLGMALYTSPVGDTSTIRWVQGRYFLPIFPLAALLLPEAIGGRRDGPPVRWWWLVPVGSLFLIGWVLVRLVVIFY